MSGLLEGDKILIVGGRQGIGRILARRLRDSGMDVIIASRSCTVTDSEKGIHAVTLDARDPDAVELCISKHRPRHTVTTCVEGIHGRLAEMNSEALKQCFEAKFWSQLHVARAACRHALPRGTMTMFSGLASRLNFDGLGIVGVINAAVERLTFQLAKEGRLRVNCIAPGIVTIPPGVTSHARSAEFLHQVALALPFGRVVSADDVAEMTVRLMENEAINGTTIVIDGGQRAVSTAYP